MAVRSYSLPDVWPIINRWKTLLGAAVALAFVVSLLATFLLPNIYKSTALFYPANPENGQPSTRGEDLDRILTIGQSQPVAQALVLRFRLQEHYGTGQPGDPAATEAAIEHFKQHMALVHNERDVIEASFKDADRQVAAAVANALVAAIDTSNQRLTLHTHYEALEQYKLYPTLKKTQIKLRNRLIAARYHYGIFTQEQTRYLIREIIRTENELRQAEGSGASAAKIAGLRRALRGLTKIDGGNTLSLEGYVEGSDTLGSMYARLDNVQKRLDKLQEDYDAAKLALKGRSSSLYVIQPAYPTGEKVSPKRGLVVAASVVVTFVLSLLLIMLLELYRANQVPATSASPA
ncbi:hypothetical protein MUN82_03710 [Hymenobacter aerilatus]|uniref:Polysaccharide chain length determinant N-terminal domain-containing protein n=1 Tax=Hymenobacter aerilatus TaxID=2932251 RepID=A0A8T9SWU3_9BACT|nr:hypothetical protein [Hymenobacter aerilatus]UOR06207.1 hypothetical protein MUN82_03710 [Hymenobacter aerilatus]